MESEWRWRTRLSSSLPRLVLPCPSFLLCLRVKTGHCSFGGIINLAMKGHVWTGLSLNKGSLQSLLSSNFKIVPISTEPKVPCGYNLWGCKK